MLMNRLITSNESGINLFEGFSGHLLPRYDYDMLSGGLFHILGKMILHSVLNGCHGIAGLSSAVIAYLCTGCRDAAVQHITLEDYPDPVLQKKLKELLCCESAKLVEFSNPDSPLGIIEELQSAGYPHVEITESKRHYAYECCLINEIITKQLPALDDIRKGIGEVNVMGTTLLVLLERSPEIQTLVFPVFENCVSAKDLRRHLVFEDCPDSKSEQAKLWFGQYVDELEQRDKDSGLESLSGLVQFWTSYPTLPPSVSRILKVTYLEDSSTKLLAEANICPMVLSIPVVHPSYDSFKAFLDKSIAMAKVGFGKM